MSFFRAIRMSTFPMGQTIIKVAVFLKFATTLWSYTNLLHMNIRPGRLLKKELKVTVLWIHLSSHYPMALWKTIASSQLYFVMQRVNFSKKTFSKGHCLLPSHNPLTKIRQASSCKVSASWWEAQQSINYHTHRELGREKGRVQVSLSPTGE